MGTFNIKFARKKRHFSEEEAKKAILDSNPEIQEADLVAAHTVAMWHWSLKESTGSDQQPENEAQSFTYNGKTTPFTVEKDNDYSLEAALQSAADHFENPIGNIKIQDEDETHIVFILHGG